MSTVLKKITGEAKKIRKRHPGKSWKTAVKEAGKKYRAGKISGVRRKPAKKKTARKRPPARKRRRVGASPAIRKLRAAHAREGQLLSKMGSVKQHIGIAKKQLKEQVGWYEASKLSAKTVRSKRNIDKKIKTLKAQYRKL